MEKIFSDKIFDFYYYEALKDATLRNTCETDSRDRMFDINNKDSNAIKDKVKEYIKKIIDGNLKEGECEKTIKSISEEAKKFAQDFTFGNAQKLVNMMAKYFYALAYVCDEKRENFENCDCPMDRIMLKEISDYCKRIKNNANEKNDGELIRKAENWDSMAEISWSKINIEDIGIYKEYQSRVKELMKSDIFIEEYGELKSPLEVDFVLWNSVKEKK